MIRTILLCAAIATAFGDTTGTDTNSNVTKRQVLEFYPDWVPFKNKHGNDLGEFVDVIKPKAKVKKRLALPMNFLIRAISDDSGDYMGQGESDSEDYYDKKDWSDLNRPIINVSEPISKENISDIEGVINIITQERPNLAEDIKKSLPKKIEVNQDDYEDEPPNEKANITVSVDDLTTTMGPELKFVLTPSSKIALFNEYEDDSETTTTQSPQDSEAEQRENEEKKKIILDGVDQLKHRHEQEAKAISDKNKHDEYDNEHRHRSIKIKKNRGSNSKRQRGKPTPPNYDEYEDMSYKDKYNINIEKKTTAQNEDTDDPSPQVTINPTEETTIKPKKSDRGKYSVFRNPSLYIIDQDDDNENLRRKKPSNIPRRFSSKYSSSEQSTKNSAENDINPPPVASTTEKFEPILYFPKLKPKRKLKQVKTTKATDSYVAETVEDKLTNKHTTQPMALPDTTAVEATEDYKTTALDTDYPSTTASLWKEDNADSNNNKFKKSLNNRIKDVTIYDDTTIHNEDLTTAGDTPTGPSGEAETSNTETITDAEPASSDHKKEEPEKDYHVEKGGGHEHHSSHEEEHEEHGKKAYEGLHKDSKTKKGHHDKEDHLGKYEDNAGHQKKHHDESGHYGVHNHEERGKKHAKYEESGKHSKGHSTKGSHDIHKKEEYEKNVEFFEEDGDSGEEEKHGGYHNEKKHKSGGLYKKGNHENEHHERKKGESGHFVKGGHHDVDKGHKSSGGHDGHGKRGHAGHAAGGQQSGKKWVYHHGYPAKTANLIVIDRRTDGYMHGPNYYG